MKNMAEEKIVVFGGAGFLGAYLVDLLIKTGYKVFAADIKRTKYISESVYTKCDILNRNEVRNIVCDATVVFNFAGFANLDRAIENPYETINLNVLGNLNILDAIREFKVKRYIYASSAYAMNTKASFYGLSKLTSEKIIEEYSRVYDIGFTIIRFGSVYSARNYENNYIFNLVKGVIRNHYINHQGDGEEIREYIHAEDAAKLSLEIMENLEYIGQHIILTGFERIKRKELFLMIQEILGEDIQVRFDIDKKSNHYQQTPYQFQPERSKKLIANPFIDLGQGILKCIQNIVDNDE